MSRERLLHTKHLDHNSDRISWNLDWNLWKLHKQLVLLTGFLIIVSLLMVYSSSAVLAFSEGKSPFHYLLLQIAWIGVGLIVMLIAYQVPLKLLARVSVPLMVFAIFSLILVLFIGKELNGATRWIDLGPFDLQPSEVTKLAFIIYLAAWLSRKRPVFKDIREAFQQHFYQDILPFMILLGIICVLIILQPDLDTAVIIAGTALAIYFVSGQDALHTLGALFILITSGLLGVFAAVAEEYRLDRVKTYISFLFTGRVEDPRGTGAQVYNALLAIASGGLFGVGYGESRIKLFYIGNPAFTDSIFAIIAEEFGLVGSLVIIVSFLYLLSLGIDIARKSEDKFAALLAVGITTWIVLQAFLNIGANLALIPFGGIPLPIISYGGSSTLVVMAGIGLLLNVHKNNQA